LTSCDEFPFAKGTETSLALPTLGLDVDHVEPKAVFFDGAVYPLVAALADRFARVLQASAIAHLYEEIDNETLELMWRDFEDLLQQVIG
jgi:hypothetical protein